MSEVKGKKVCKCENCGNEAEMVVTCSLETPSESAGTSAGEPAPHSHRAKGRGVCATCGNEADMWIDL
jgi:hypothetical protein